MHDAPGFDEFRALAGAFASARRAMRDLHPDVHVRRDFARVEYLMEELAGFYGMDLRASQWDDQHRRRGGGPGRSWGRSSTADPRHRY